MSQAHKETIICPKCEVQGDFIIWDSMNVDLNPELRDAILDESAFIYTCPKCGHRIMVPYSTLYHDMTHQFLLFFDFFKPDDYKYEPIEIPPFEGESARKYVYRHVTGLMHLKEKIFILEKGLNDVAIEHLKYMITHHIRPEFAKKEYDLFFYGVDYDDVKESKEGTFRFIYNDENNDTFVITLPMERYYEHQLACKLDPRMNVVQCVNVDEEWISQQFKKSAL